MNTTPLIPLIETDAVAPVDDDSLVELFAEGGLTVAVVDTCGDASCPSCFPVAPARAA